MTFENTMIKALMDTLMGMGSVFMILILICIIISLFRLIPKEGAAPVDASKPGAASAINDAENENELIAVITAAIKAAMASEKLPEIPLGEKNEPVFIVKSVKRRR